MYVTPDQAHITGLMSFWIYLNTVTNGIWTAGFLTALWIGLAFTVFFAKQKTIGTGDFVAAFVSASFVTGVSAILLRLYPGAIDDITFGIAIATLLIGVLLLFFNDEQ